jgi:uncharacterized protein
MADPFLVIDGYNLLHAAGLARKKYVGAQLHNARRQLLFYLASHLSASERERTTVVFDAGDAPTDVARQMTVEGMSVEFARPGGDADTLIEEILQSHPAPRSVRVVSSDHRLQKAARRRRATSVDSDMFVTELEHRGPIATEPAADVSPQSARNPKFSGEANENETELWMRVFGDIPEAKELESEAQQWRDWTEQLRKELEEETDPEDRKDR